MFDFAPGNHIATIAVNDTLGSSDSESFTFVTPGRVGEWCQLVLYPDLYSRMSRGLGTRLSAISMSVIVCCHGDANSSIVYRPSPIFYSASVEKIYTCDMMV